MTLRPAWTSFADHVRVAFGALSKLQPASPLRASPSSAPFRTAPAASSACRLASGRGKNARHSFEVRAFHRRRRWGVAARLATSLGLEKKMNRPMGVAARALHFHSPGGRRGMDGIPPELWERHPRRLRTCCPATADLPHGDGIVGTVFGLPRLGARRRHSTCLTAGSGLTANPFEEWGSPLRTRSVSSGSAAPPMSFNRKPATLHPGPRPSWATAAWSPPQRRRHRPGHEG